MSYDLQSIKAPRLTGKLLRAFTAVIEQDITASLLIPKLLTDAGITAFRRLEVDESPTWHPLNSPSSTQMRKKVSKPDLETVPEVAAGDTPGGFRYRTIDDYARAYRRGECTPEQVARSFLAALSESEKNSPPLRAFIASYEEDIMTQAKASTERFGLGKPRGILDGVPIAVKDEVDQVPYPTTVGTAFLGKQPASQDSTVVARLRDAGALLIGKTNMHEIGIGVTGFNANHGTVRNPVNPRHYPGGSSSGSAAAVGAGLCPVAIGADGGGSIRIPSAFCGVVGLKATFGRISEHGAAPLCWTVAHIGPIGATARDVAAVYATIAGPDPHDRWTQVQPKVHLTNWDSIDMRGLRLGIYEPWFSHARGNVVAACRRMLDFFTDQGAVLCPIDIEGLEAIRVAHVITIATEMSSAMDRYYGRFRHIFGNDVRINLVLGRHLTNRDYVLAQRVRTKAMNHINSLLSSVDAIVTPATGCTAPLIADDVHPDGESNLTILSEIMRFAPMPNLVGLPAISFPAGYDDHGMPVGLQVIGRPWEEHVLLGLAHMAEKALKRRTPAVWFDLLQNANS